MAFQRITYAGQYPPLTPPSASDVASFAALHASLRQSLPELAREGDRILNEEMLAEPSASTAADNGFVRREASFRQVLREVGKAREYLDWLVQGSSSSSGGGFRKVVRLVHYCPATGAHESRTYVDATDPELGLPVVDESGRELPDRVVQLTSASYPTVDREGRALETEFGLSAYKDHQTVTLQEMPEMAPMGQLPRSVELVLDHDLVDRVKPGDRVQVVGVYRALSSASQGQRSTSGVFPTVVLVNDVRVLGRDSHGLVFTPNNVRTIRSLGKRADILDVLGRSVCPSIHGHNVIKRALALQLLGGCEKNLANGTQ
jgi:DNA replication licensing factor MCM3